MSEEQIMAIEALQAQIKTLEAEVDEVRPMVQILSRQVRAHERTIAELRDALFDARRKATEVVDEYVMHREQSDPDVNVGHARLWGASRVRSEVSAIIDAALAAPIPQPQSQRDERQKIIGAWAIACFTKREARSIPQRGIRLQEESTETFQACGGTREQAHAVVDYVFDRPSGSISQEMGGVGVTLLALGEAIGVSADECEAKEVDRVLSKPTEHFAARNKQKNDAGLSAPIPSEVPPEPAPEVKP